MKKILYFSSLILLLSPLEARYRTEECASECRPTKPVVTSCKRIVPKIVEVKKEITCKRPGWKKVKYKQKVCTMVPKYSYKECYKMVPTYSDQKMVKVSKKTIYCEEELIPQAEECPCDCCSQ